MRAGGLVQVISQHCCSATRWSVASIRYSDVNGKVGLSRPDVSSIVCRESQDLKLLVLTFGT